MTPTTRTSRSNSLPRDSSIQSPTWAPPRAPLPPHRLAKIANALGVSMPLPAGYTSSSYGAPSPINLSTSPISLFPDPHQHLLRRSPTPSAASTSYTTYSSTPTPQSKFLLHVVPPLHLPHDSTDNENGNDFGDLAPPPSSASGYHTQFRRGTLVPVCPTLQAQLGVIAKEYALPSTAGMILYLVSSTPSPSPGALTPKDPSDGFDEPGPRISEEIWSIVWARVLRAEREENARSYASGGNGTPPGGSSSNLRPLMTPLRVETPQPAFPYPPTPSPSTPSSASDPRSKSSLANGNTPSSNTSRSYSLNEPDTPASSIPTDRDSPSLDLALPGLTSPSLIPILAKVEFDIDRRKAAGWYDAWVRSRRANKGWRSGSEAEVTNGSGGRELELVRKEIRRGASPAFLIEDEDKEREKQRLLLEAEAELERVLGLDVEIALEPEPEPEHGLEDEFDHDNEDEQDEEATDGALGVGDGYAPLSESEEPSGGHDEGEEEPGSSFEDELDQFDPEEFDEPTARLSYSSPALAETKDPLQDVFGSDGEAWADIHAELQASAPSPHVPSNPNIVELSLDAAALSSHPDDLHLDEEELMTPGDDVQDVEQLWDQHMRPRLSVAIPTSPPSTSSAGRRTSSPRTAGTIRRHIPPPLQIPPIPSGSGADLSIPITTPLPTADSTRLAYLYSDGTPTPSTEDPGSSGSSKEGSREPSRERGVEVGNESAEFARMRSPADEKREGVVYEDLELGLDLSELDGGDEEYDENDPNDRRRSQYLMKAKLDEIEKALASLSPRRLPSELAEDTYDPPERSSSLTARSVSLAPPGGLSPPRLGRDRSQTVTAPTEAAPGAQWPAVPFSAISTHDGSAPSSAPPTSGSSSEPSVPRLTVNGISRDLPTSPYSPPTRPPGMSESQLRKRELDEQGVAYHVGPPPSIPAQRNDDGSPILPLSPDPFGRYPSAESVAIVGHRYSEDRQSLASSNSQYSTEREGSPFDPTRRTPSSRFSADSTTIHEKQPVEEKKIPPKVTTAPLVSVKGLKKLWRKTNKTSISQQQQAPPPQIPQPQQQQSRQQYQQQQHERSASTSGSGRISPQPPLNSSQHPPPAPPTRTTSLSPPPHPTPAGQAHHQPHQHHQHHHRQEASLANLHFDQESPYPFRRASPIPPPPSRPPPIPPPTTSSPVHPSPPLPSATLPPEKGGTRKSILKSWKSNSNVSQNGSNSNGDSATAGDAGRKRRPSVLGLAAGLIRGSTDIPPSPILPDHLANANRGNRQSQASAAVNGSRPSLSQPRQSYDRSGRPSYDTSGRPSYDTSGRPSYETSGRPSHETTASSSSYRPSGSEDEDHDGQSFDTSEFEMVSPEMGPTGLRYPYTDMDHQERPL